MLLARRPVVQAGQACPPVKGRQQADRAATRSTPVAALAASISAQNCSQRSVNDVLDYDRIHYELMAESYRWELWGAAYLINGGCSDDGFDYFRGWLLGQGRATWQAALADPDSLASVGARKSVVGAELRVRRRGHHAVMIGV